MSTHKIALYDDISKIFLNYHQICTLSLHLTPTISYYMSNMYHVTKNNEKKAISNAYLIPPAQYWSIKKMISEYKGHKNMQKTGFLMNQLI